MLAYFCHSTYEKLKLSEMRKLLVLFLFLSSTLFLSAQNFYVLSIKGSVSCNDKKLKKKDKLSIEDALVFGNRESEIRLINSDGHYSLKGSMIQPNQQNELIAELKKDLGIDNPAMESLVALSPPGFDPDDTRQYWYEFQPYSFYSTIISPSFLTTEMEEAGDLQLVQVYGDTLFTRQLKKRNGTYKLKEKYFKTKLKEAPSYYAVVWQATSNKHLREASRIYSIRPKKFIKAKSLRKDIQFIKEKANIQNADELLEMIRDILDDSYGEYEYIPETIKPLVNKVMKK